MADDIAATDPVPRLDVGNKRDDRGDLFIGERAISKLMAGIDDFNPDTG